MFTLLISAIVFLTLGTALKIFKGPYQDANGNVDAKKITNFLIVLLVSIVVALVQPVQLQQIDAGSVGLKIDKVGNEKGIPRVTPCKGYVFYNSWTTDVVEYSIGQNHVGYSPFTVTTKGGFPMKVQPSYNYALIPEKAGALYINLLKGNDFSSLTDNFLLTATTLALNNASNKYPIDSIFNNKEGYNRAVAEELNRELQAYFVVSQINPGSIAPPELANVIRAKTEAVQKAQQADLDKITAEAEAATKVATAKGNADAAVIEAEGEAEAIRKKQAVMTPTYVEYIKWQKWDGALPTTVTGNTMMSMPLK